MNAPRIIVLSLLLAILLSNFSYAVVDLLNPTDQNATNNTTVSFEYYASLQNLTSCTVAVGANAFADAHAHSNTMNSVKVQGILPGTYTWNVSCAGDDGTETSSSRSFTVDVHTPTLVIASPLNGSTQKEIPLDIVVNDNAQAIMCQASWNGQQLESFQLGSNTHYAKTYAGTPGNGTLAVTCSDAAGNTVTQERSLAVIPAYGLLLQMDKQEYGVGEPARLIIDTLSGANVSIDVCPDQAGFVQCATALLASTTYPQTITLPYMNRTGQYIVEGMVSFAGQTRANQTKYSLLNTMSIRVKPSAQPQLNKTFNLSASIIGGIPPYRITWLLDNGTVVSDTSLLSVNFVTPGTHSAYIAVVDQANNTLSVNTTLVVNPVYSLGVRVVDGQTGAPIPRADLELNEQKTKTFNDGTADFDAEPGLYRLFTSAAGYAYALDEFSLNDSMSLEVQLNRSGNDTLQVEILAPTQGGVAYNPVSIRYNVTYAKPITCTLLLNDTPNGTMVATLGSTNEFLRDLALGQHELKVQCADALSLQGEASVSFTVGQPAGPTPSAATSAEAAKLQDTLEGIDTVLQNLDNYGQKEKEVLTLLGFDKNLRNAKRAVQQAVRDLNDLQYRTELDENAKAAESKRIIDAANAVVAATPMGLTVTDSKTFVRYLKAEDVDKVAAALAGLGGLQQDQAALARHLAADQQKFTLSTKLVALDYLFGDGSAKSITVVSRSITYAANLGNDYAIYEIIPKEVAKSARDLNLITNADVLKDDPVLRFGQEESITYVIPRHIDFTRVQEISTVLTKPYAEETSLFSGMVIFDGVSIGGSQSWLILLCALIAMFYLAVHFNLAKQVRFLAYKLGRKEKVHYVRVLINDALDHLTTDGYEKADMLYKEIRLTYDTLSVPARNDLYEDVLDLVKKMDAYYFNLIMLELDSNIKAGDVEGAISSYEKLTGTFERLDQQMQEQLVTAVTAMARRVGLTVHT